MGVHTVTCAGAEDNAGNKAPAVQVRYTVGYGFGGFIAPKPGTTLKRSASSVTVEFRLATSNGATVSPAIAAALAAHRDVRATLLGPGIAAATATCQWNSRGRYLDCKISTPRGVKTGRSHRYSITVTENPGGGFLQVPGVGKAQNPEYVYFR